MDYSLLLIIFKRNKKEEEESIIRKQGTNSFGKTRRNQPGMRSVDFSGINLKKGVPDVSIQDLHRMTTLPKQKFGMKRESSYQNFIESEMGITPDIRYESNPKIEENDQDVRPLI
jgi:hypothetical protein